MIVYDRWYYQIWKLNYFKILSKNFSNNKYIEDQYKYTTYELTFQGRGQVIEICPITNYFATSDEWTHFC